MASHSGRAVVPPLSFDPRQFHTPNNATQHRPTEIAASAFRIPSVTNSGVFGSPRRSQVNGWASTTTERSLAVSYLTTRPRFWSTLGSSGRSCHPTISRLIGDQVGRSSPGGRRWTRVKPSRSNCALVSALRYLRASATSKLMPDAASSSACWENTAEPYLPTPLGSAARWLSFASLDGSLLGVVPVTTSSDDLPRLVIAPPTIPTIEGPTRAPVAQDAVPAAGPPPPLDHGRVGCRFCQAMRHKASERALAAWLAGQNRPSTGAVVEGGFEHRTWPRRVTSPSWLRHPGSFGAPRPVPTAQRLQRLFRWPRRHVTPVTRQRTVRGRQSAPPGDRRSNRTEPTRPSTVRGASSCQATTVGRPPIHLQPTRYSCSHLLGVRLSFVGRTCSFGTKPAC